MLLNVEHTDVIIIGGGPVGLLNAYILQRLGVSTIVIERNVKDEMPMYGRACTLYSRSLEFLDQVELLDDFLQVGLIAYNGVNFDKAGKRVNSRGWQPAFASYTGTFLDFFLNIRLKYSERLIQNGYEASGSQVVAGWEMADMLVDPNASDGYKVTTVISQVGKEGHSKTVKSKYIIGADGSNSKVRQLSGIPWNPDRTVYRWVRIDGVVKTNMPDERIGISSIESPTHGNVLWVPLDHGRTRVGFALTPRLAQQYGHDMSQEDAVKEAIAALKPFALEYKCVDWHTVYSIQQGVADTYIMDDCIILAGDACHTHSSGAAQGMNTGVHDAVNLTWKLAGVIKGWFKADILDTYNTERRPIAQDLINQDKEVSKAITEADRPDATWTQHPLTTFIKQNGQFVVGHGIFYNENLLNVSANAGSIASGYHPHDALVYGPGSRVPTRLQKVTPNVGAFWVLVFTGAIAYTRPQLAVLRSHVDGTDSFTHKYKPGAIKLITIVDGQKGHAEEAMGMKTFGKFYYDNQSDVIISFGFSIEEGGIAVLRPDGYLGFATALDKGSEVDAYFKNILLPL